MITQTKNEIVKGIPASDGIAIGPLFRYEPTRLEVPECAVTDVEAEFGRFQNACAQADIELARLSAAIQKRAGAEAAGIFEAHRMLLADPTLHEMIKKSITIGKNAEAAVIAAADELAAVFSEMEDELFAARAADVRDLGRRVLRILLGVPDTSLGGLAVPSIIVAHDLSPSDTASLQPEMTLGLCAAAGGKTSHSAILARTLGIPAVVGIGSDVLARLQTGIPAALNGAEGTLRIDPTADEIEQMRQAQSQRQTHIAKMQSKASAEAHTADGLRIEVAANIGSVESAQAAVHEGAEGVGLLRTEFLYLEERIPPSEQRQMDTYRAIFEAMQGRRVIIRTLDIGGDKPPSFLEFKPEMNPFLGWRAIRISLDEPALFKTQLRAILRAAHGHSAAIMYPMINGLDELRKANALLKECEAELEHEGLPYAKNIPTGIMVETPAAVLIADMLAPDCDFFSIGTNDLTQYTLAVDRGNERVAGLFNSLHPAVLRAIKMTIDAGHRHGKWVGMCGELAGQKNAIPLLLGLGLDEFSMGARAIPEAKWIIGKLTLSQAREIAEHTLTLNTTAQVESYLSERLAALQQ